MDRFELHCFELRTATLWIQQSVPLQFGRLVPLDEDNGRAMLHFVYQFPQLRFSVTNGHGLRA